MLKKLINRWSAPNGYRELLVIAFPLILSTASWSFMHFIDRMMLTWYSEEAIAAAMPAGILNFTLMSLFIGAAGYVTTFVAQYFGADRRREIGMYLWQGLYVALAGTVLLSVCIPLSPVIFPLFGHGADVAHQESLYFQALCLGAFPAIANAALSSFFSGTGKTLPVMMVNILMAVVNIVLDYIMIFGKFGCPEMGIFGAGLATTISAFAGMAIFCVLIFTKENEKKYAIISRFRLVPHALLRLLRFGIPSGFQMFMDVAGFTAFIIILGGLGKEALAASNIAFSINTLAFMPMVGLGTAVSVMAGQAMGRQSIPDAAKVTFSGSHLAVLYMGTIGLLYLFFPGLFLSPFLKEQASANGFYPIAVNLLKFIAVYSFFDGFGLVFGSALKGAGDTRFIMIINSVYALGVMVIPAWLIVFVLHLNIYFAWVVSSAYIVLLAMTFFLRFLTGRWKTMQVIDRDEGKTTGNLPETPVPINL